MTLDNPQPASATGAGRQRIRQSQAAANAKARLAAGAIATQPYDWSQDPIWEVPIPEWGDCDPEQQQRIREAFDTAALLLAIRRLAKSRNSTAAALLNDWGANAN